MNYGPMLRKAAALLLEQPDLRPEWSRLSAKELLDAARDHDSDGGRCRGSADCVAVQDAQSVIRAAEDRVRPALRPAPLIDYELLLAHEWEQRYCEARAEVDRLEEKVTELEGLVADLRNMLREQGEQQ